MQTSETIGKWHFILPTLGVDNRSLVNKHGSCPKCGGKDRFRYDDKRGCGTYYCNQCGAGDGFKLLMLLNGWSFVETIKKIEEILMTTNVQKKIAPKIDRSANKQRLNSTWSKSRPIMGIGNNIVYNYLKGRGLSDNTIRNAKNIKTINNLTYWDQGKSLGDFSALLAMIVNQGKSSTIHATYIRNLHNGQSAKKAFVPSPRKLLPRTDVPIIGGAIELYPIKDGVLGLAEGIETAMSCHQMYGDAVWATVSAGGLAGFVVPKEVTRLNIYADNDESFTGQVSGYMLARQTKLTGIEVNVFMPKQVGHDFNDVLRFQ